MDAPKFEETFLDKVLKHLNPKYDQVQYGFDWEHKLSIKEDIVNGGYCMLNTGKSAIRGIAIGGLVGIIAKELGATHQEAGNLFSSIAITDLMQYIFRSDILPLMKFVYRKGEEFSEGK